MSEAALEAELEHWRGAAGPAGERLLDERGFRERLLQVWAASEYVMQQCRRTPELLPRLAEQQLLSAGLPAGRMAALLEQALTDVPDEASLHGALRRFRRDQMVRIIWRDLGELAPLEETLEDLSALADACIEGALERLYAWGVQTHGTPRDANGEPQRLVVLGMGKLGARELNLSSDIDLIFTFPAAGETDGRRPQANEQFFTRLCRQLIKALGSQTADGFVFRVDARLRPFGDAGPLALSFDAMEVYYQAQAREWERYAMIKARVVAGDQQAGAELLALLRPFVYRRYLDFGAIESLRDLKKLISQELHRKGMEANVKLGPGGIREIEFIGQAFQLVRGGRDPELQIRPILPVLEQIAKKQLLPEFVVQELCAAYRFLRLVENRIQAWQDRQTHQLPEDEAGRLRIARSMGCDDWAGFFAQLEQHRERVQAHFDRVFAAPQTEEDAAEPQPLAELWREQLEEAAAAAALQQSGYPDPAWALGRIRQFAQGHACRALGVRGQQRMDQLMPLLLEAVAGAEEPGPTLERVLRLMESIARRTAYLALLVETPLALSQLVRLTGVSPWIADQLARHPLLLDELLDPRRLYSPLKLEGLKSDVGEMLDAVDPEDLEQQMDRLRQFARSQRLRVAAADITEAISVMVVSDYLTWIAEAISAEVLALAWNHLTRKHGRPRGLPVAGNGFAVIGYGKLGGIELGYGSDLDLVFLHANQDPNAMTDGPKPTANDVFYQRLGQRMIHLFTTRTAAGALFEIDMRLRPNGNAGMLATPLDAFESYQEDAAWTWEHQALVRARAIAGDPELCARFEGIRRRILSREREPETLRSAVREMREKMRANLDKSDQRQFDLKQGAGGIADIEFMVQYAVLRWACRYPDLMQWSDNIRLLETLEKHRVLPAGQAETLADCYRAFRAAHHRNVLQDRPGTLPAHWLETERAQVRTAWQRLMETSA